MDKNIDMMQKAMVVAVQKHLMNSFTQEEAKEVMEKIAGIPEAPVQNEIPIEKLVKYMYCIPYKPFFPNQCHICHCLESELQTLKRCSQCQMISYCSKVHQKQDWPFHKEFCKVIADLGAGPKMFQKLKENYDPAASMIEKVAQIKLRNEIKISIMKNVIKRLGRKLEYFEWQMIYHPRICFTCFESEAELTNCRICPIASFCKEHINDSEHSILCPQLKLCQKIELDKHYRSDIFLNPSSVLDCNIPKTGLLPKSMNEFLQTSVKLNKNVMKYWECPELWKVYLSELVSKPLILVHVVQKLKLPTKSRFVVHVIDAELDEFAKSLWEIILHWLPAVIELRIVFIGPKVKEGKTYKVNPLCKKCCEEKKKFIYETFNDNYENCSSLSIHAQKPDIVVGYNIDPSLYPTWLNTIDKLIIMKSPLILTASSEKEIYRNHYWVKICLCTAELHSLQKNPFESLWVERNVDDERLIVKNKYLMIYDDLYNLSKKPSSGNSVNLETTNSFGRNLHDLSTTLKSHRSNISKKVSSNKKVVSKQKTEPMTQIERRLNKRLQEELNKSRK